MMNQPPNNKLHTTRPAAKPPAWRRPDGVAPGTWDYFHQRSIADHYDAFVEDAPMQSVERDWLASHFPIRSEMEIDQKTHQIIDLGCGTGRSALPLAQAGYEVLAVDLSQPMLDQLAKKTAARNLEHRIHPLQANLVELDEIDENHVDDAICLFATLGMIQFRRYRRQSLRHVHRIVRPGGRFLFHVHHQWATLREPGGIWKLTRSFLRSWTHPGHPWGDSTYAYRGLDQMYMHCFSRREIQQDLQATGWKLASLQRLSIDGKQWTGRWPICGGFFVTAICQKH